MMSLEDRVLSRVAPSPTPRTPQHPPGHRWVAGLRRVEVPGKLVRCVIGCEEGVQGVRVVGGFACCHGGRCLWTAAEGAKSPL